ncbi:MAG TPA: M1 family metallopeptidase [Pyrinomonadaceae bacterium]|jgi:aminopeptidase N|nr:M1 family metallopeptidase [Pyrinomonadaceae bacterium]
MKACLQTTTRNISLAALVLILSSLTGFALRRERLIDAWRPTNYNVSLTLNEQLTEITSAQADIDIVAVKTLSLVDMDFGEMTTDSVHLNNSPVTFLHRNGKLEITLPKPVGPGTKLHVTVTYHGKPKDGLILNADKDGKPSVVGDNWPDRVHHWIPSLDHPSAKATVTFNVTAPARDLVVANGQLSKVQTSDVTTKTWTYTETVPIPPYCMIIGVGDFAKLEPSGPMLTPLSYYVPHSDSAYALKGFAPTDPVLRMFTQLVGPYPYEKLAMIIGATRFGGMENSSAIVFTTTLFNPKPDARLSTAFGIPTNVEDVVAHEIAHQWFGDSVTESTWSDLWLSEGFATYFAGLFIQKYEGEEAFQTYMKSATETAFTYEKKNPIPIHDRETEDLFKLLNGNNYQKGAWVLHMLRSRLGDDAFFRGIRNYYKEHKDSTASTEDLRSALEKASGQPLRQFFERWVYDTGHPQYDVSWKWLPREGRVQVSVNQVQPGKAFLDPVPIVVTTSLGKRKFVVTPDGKLAKQMFPSNERPAGIEVDPENTILKEVTLK